MADYWGLNTGHALASGLVDAFMFDQTDIKAQVLNFTSPLTHALVGTPNRPTIDGKLAFQPAITPDGPFSYIHADGQWLTALGRSILNPFTIMLRCRIDDPPTPNERSGIVFMGLISGTRGLYFRFYQDMSIRTSYRHYDSNLWIGPVLNTDQLYRFILRSREVTTNIYVVDTWIDGTEYQSTADALGVSDDQGYRIGEWLSNPLNGAITDYFSWDRELSNQDISDLFADPYRFLVPPGVPSAGVSPVLMGSEF